MKFMIYLERLKALKERYGTTQETISNMLNISRGRYSHYEIEDDLMPLKYLNEICNYYHVSLDYIFNFTEKKQYKGLKKEINLSKNRLKEWRKSSKLTLIELSDKIKTSKSMLSMYEKGTILIPTQVLYNLCKKYHISADYLLGRIDKKITFDKNGDK